MTNHCKAELKQIQRKNRVFVVETKYSRTISLTGSSIKFLKPHRQQQSIKMKHISQNDMVISFWFYSNKTTKLAIKQKNEDFQC